MVIHRLDSLRRINYNIGFPQNLVLDVDYFVDPAKLIEMAKLKTYDYYVHGKAELDAAGFIRAEENAKRAQSSRA